ncbi:MAG: hypothetical protein NTV38_11085 [Chloroflexi bacterium]|jgi:hypothetical protein|nr:hypothetical protein [Chloroflexota bacterium]
MKRANLLLLIFVLVLSILACGTFSPPETCGEDLGGTADEALFGRYFESMELVSGNTWQPGAEGESGMQFPAGESLLIMFDAKSDVQVRACIQHTVGGGKMAFDQTSSFQNGENEFQVGTFEPGPYVIRVIVNGTLVKNLPFSINK